MSLATFDTISASTPEHRGHEDDALHRGADRLRHAAGRGQLAGQGHLPQTGRDEATFSRRKKQYAGMGVAELRRLEQLEEENKRFRRLVADLSLDKRMLQDVLAKKL
jgi:hypothetical protein